MTVGFDRAVCPVGFGGFCALAMRSVKDGMGNRRCKLACNRLFDIPYGDAANAASLSKRSLRDGRFVKYNLKEV